MCSTAENRPAARVSLHSGNSNVNRLLPRASHFYLVEKNMFVITNEHGQFNTDCANENL